MSETNEVPGMNDKLDEIQARAEAATPGPWTTSGPDTVGQFVIYDKEWAIAEARTYSHDNPMSNKEGFHGPGYIDADANAEFIAHAREDIPYLLNLIAALKGAGDE